MNGDGNGSNDEDDVAGLENGLLYIFITQTLRIFYIHRR